MSNRKENYEVNGVFLKKSEIHEFLNRYEKLHGKVFLDQEEAEEKDEFFDERQLISANGKTKDLYAFFVYEYEEETFGYEEIFFKPHFYRGKLSGRGYFYHEPVLFLYLEPAYRTKRLLEDKEIYDSWLKDLKDRVSGYLPENFDWEAHVGEIAYSILW